MFNFQPYNFDYSRDNGYALGQAADLVYRPWPDVRRVLRDWYIPKVAVFDNRGTEAFMAWTDEFVVLSFRGTDSLTDWATNINVSFAPIGIGHAHEGFVAALAKVWSPVSLKLRDIYIGQPIWLTGHSLGAALATLALVRLADSYNIGGLYTFGSPRVLSTAMAGDIETVFGNVIHRYVNNNDCVPRIPLKRLHGYGHVGNLHYFREGGVQDDDMTWAQKLKDRIHGRIADFGRPGSDGIKDHGMDEYLLCLLKNIDDIPPAPPVHGGEDQEDELL